MRHIVSMLLLFLVAMMASTAGYSAKTVTITGMRISPSPTKTVMTFQLSAKTTGVVKSIPSDHLLKLTFNHAVLRFNVHQAKLAGANVTEFSAKEMPDQTVVWTMQTTGTVTWTTRLNVDDKTGRAELVLEIVSPRPLPPAVPEKKISGRVHEEKKAVASQSATSQPVDVRKQKSHVYTVVIDAGHGGKDTGAIAKNGMREKDIVLSIARKIAARLQGKPGLRVVLTRNSDRYLPLRTRLSIARKNDADLFIAVHADAYFNDEARGVSVYALSQHGATNEASRWLAQQERYDELDNIEFGQLEDKSRMVRSVLIDLSQAATIRDSIHLGNKILSALHHVSKLHYRHVEQAPFVVLKSPDIPSILVETGFVSNPAEAANLASASYQNKLADALCLGINAYIKKYASR